MVWPPNTLLGARQFHFQVVLSTFGENFKSRTGPVICHLPEIVCSLYLLFVCSIYLLDTLL